LVAAATLRAPTALRTRSGVPSKVDIAVPASPRRGRGFELLGVDDPWARPSRSSRPGFVEMRTSQWGAATRVLGRCRGWPTWRRGGAVASPWLRCGGAQSATSRRRGAGLTRRRRGLASRGRGDGGGGAMGKEQRKRVAALVLIGGAARVPRVGVHPRRPRPRWDTRRESRARVAGSRGARARECSGAGAPPSGGGGSAWELAWLLGLRTVLAPSWATAWALATWGSWAGAGWWCRVGFAEGLGRGK